MPDLFPPAMAGAASLLAIVSLIGWQFRLVALREPFGGFMAPNSALCILALSVAIVLLRWRDHRIVRATGVFLAVFTTALCSVNLYEHLSDTSTGLTQIFFHHRLSDWDLPTVPGRFAPNAAIALILLSVSIILGYFRKRRELAQNMTGMALLLSLLAIIGHAYDISVFYNLRIQNYMAVSTALAFLCLGAGTLMAIIPDGWVAMVLRSDAAGVLSRRVLFITYMTIPLLGYIAVSYERNNWVSSKVGISLVVLASLLILTSTVVRSAREIRTLERERVLTEDRLREAEKLAATGRLAATLAHEVNNPLEAVMNLLYLLGNETGLNENSKEFLKLAEEELLRVTHITRQTLAFYREPSSPIPVQLGDQVQQVLRVFQPKLREKRVTVQFASNATAEYVIHAGEFKQIVTNLLANAIDAVSRDGIISIRVRPTRDWSTGGETGFRITIADNGTGISRTDRKKLFQPFFTTKGQRGTGLGLWVTQGLVTKHGGRLRMHSCTRSLHRGTTFSIFFPAAWQATQVEEKAAAFRNAG
ncbi:MAG TPA: HAMP domain-containing sensor histidine kinase [Terriglobales bacterium]